MPTNNFTLTNSGRPRHGINVCPNEIMFAHLCCSCCVGARWRCPRGPDVASSLDTRAAWVLWGIIINYRTVCLKKGGVPDWIQIVSLVYWHNAIICTLWESQCLPYAGYVFFLFDKIYIYIPAPLARAAKKILVLLSALVERFGVSRMRDFPSIGPLGRCFL